MDKRDKIIIAGLAIILIMLLFNIASTIYNAIDYEQRKQNGNDRWLQVENRILQTENKIKQLEEEIETWRQ